MFVHNITNAAQASARAYLLSGVSCLGMARRLAVVAGVLGALTVADARAQTIVDNGDTGTNTGSMTVSDPDAVGFLIRNASTGINEGLITLVGDRSTGIRIETGSTGINNGEFISSGVGVTGIVIETGSTGTNNAELTFLGANSVGIRINNATGINNGVIKMTGDNSTGIVIEAGGSGTNNPASILTGNITLDGSNSTGILVRTGAISAINDGDITVNGPGSTGVVLEAGTTGTNSNTGAISAYGAGSTGVVIGAGATGINRGNISAHETETSGVKLQGGTLENTGYIQGGGGAAVAVHVEGAGNVLTNTQKISTDDSSGSAIVLGAGAGLTINQSGMGGIFAYDGGHGILIAPGAVSLHVNGDSVRQITSYYGNAIENAGEISDLKLTGAYLMAGDGHGVRTATSFSNTNSGVIVVARSGSGIAFQNADGSQTTNSLDLSNSQGLTINVVGTDGTGIRANTTGVVNTAVTVDVQSEDGGSALWLGDGVTTVINGGVLTSVSTTAPTVFTNKVTNFTNSGTITAPNGVGTALAFDAQDTTLVNTGTLNGLVDLGAGNNTMTVDGGTVNGAITVSGDGTNALLLTNAATITTFTGSGGADTVTLRGNGNTFTALDGAAGNDTLVLDAATYAVADLAAATNFEQLNLTNASVLTGDLMTPAMGVGVDATSSWMLTGNSSIGTLTNAGLVDVGGSAGARTLTVQNLVGQGGTVRLYTVLGGDNSSSDRIVVDGGTATGSTKLAIVQVGGLGAATPGNGIQVVEALNGATTGGAFTLAGPVAAGAYEYTLFYGARDGSATDSWYLRSDVLAPPPPPGCEATNTCPVPPAPVDNIRPEVSLYSAANSMPLVYGRTLLDGLHKRVGEEEDLRGRLGQSDGSIANGAWGRMIGQFGEIEGNGVRGNGPDYDYKLYTMQAGLDVFRHTGDTGHRDHVGFYLAAGRMEADVTADNGRRAGKNVMDAYSLGGYWTHFGPTGWYVDAVLQGTLYDMDITSGRDLGSMQTDGYGLAASLEVGYPIRLGGSLVLEPQAQIVWQNTSLDGDDAGTNTRVDFGDGRSLAGRLGARLANSWTLQEGTPTASPLLLTAWVSPNVWHEFEGDTHTTVADGNGANGVRFNSDLGGTWGEVNVGVNAQINRATSLIANAGYSFGLGGVDRTAYEGRVGLRVNW